MPDPRVERVLVDVARFRDLVPSEMARQLGRPLSEAESAALARAVDVAIRTGASAEQTAAMAKFLSFLSHDLRGGLNGAVLMIEVLKRELAGEAKFADAIEDLDVVRRSILDTVATMERFLNAEKLRLGRMPVAIAPVAVRKLMEDIQKSFVYQLRDRGIDLQLELEGDLEICSDRQLLTMVLTNLVSNGIKYGGRKDVRLGFAAGAGLPAGVRCRFSVVDSGPGIAPERVEQLFRAFEQGETYGQKGIGLGLFIARQAAELLGARLSVESTPGSGSTFHLDLTQA